MKVIYTLVIVLFTSVLYFGTDSARAQRATPTPAPTPGPHDPTQWHIPAIHDHGHAPPQWVTDFSMTNFGYGVVYGGDERSSDEENVMKHEAYKGIVLQRVGGGEGYLRYHAATNPLDRCAQFHSFEMYYKDTSNNISFWQGTYNAGDPATKRIPRNQASGTDPTGIILVVDQASFNDGITTENWYPAPRAAWQPDFDILIGASTIWSGGECATAMDQSTWTLTGDKGLGRTVNFTWTAPSQTGWFCALQTGVIVDCIEQGALKQYVAPTLSNDAVVGRESLQVVASAVVNFSCAFCQVPN